MPAARPDFGGYDDASDLNEYGPEPGVSGRVADLATIVVDRFEVRLGAP
jgi:hypothetical protein